MNCFQFTCEKRKSYKRHPFTNKVNIDINKKKTKCQRTADKDYMPHKGLTAIT